jgi:hypothetical protein
MLLNAVFGIGNALGRLKAMMQQQSCDQDGAFLPFILLASRDRNYNGIMSRYK